MKGKKNHHLNTRVITAIGKIHTWMLKLVGESFFKKSRYLHSLKLSLPQQKKLLTKKDKNSKCIVEKPGRYPLTKRSRLTRLTSPLIRHSYIMQPDIIQ